MRAALVVQHAATCPPARLGRWLAEDGFTLDVRRPDQGQPLPTHLDRHAALVVLGGEMNAYDDGPYPWLPQTRALLAEAVRRERPTLGVCLGHQLLAVGTGGRVEPSASGPQLGLHPVDRTPAAAADPLLGELPADAAAVHWNEDLVTRLPDGAVELARTPAGAQAYRLGAAAWGVQFHPEADATVLRAWAAADVAAGRLAPERAARLLAEVAAADRGVQATWRAWARRFTQLLA